MDLSTGRRTGTHSFFWQPNQVYTWSDDGSAISIVIQIDPTVTSARVDVKIMSNNVKAGIKGNLPILQVACDVFGVFKQNLVRTCRKNMSD